MNEFQDVVEGSRPGSPGWTGWAREDQLRGPFSLPPGAEGFSFTLYQSTSVGLAAGHRVELLENGEVFDRILEDVRGATRSLHLLLYIWRPCALSDRFVEAVRERSRAGVRCRVVVDPDGSKASQREFQKRVRRPLEEAGVELHLYRQRVGSLLGRLLGRSHQRVVVVDGRAAYTGGFGLWKVWEGDGRSKNHWRDLHLRVEGPEVRRMQVTFARHWQEAGGGFLPRECFPDLEEREGVAAAFIDSCGQMGLSAAERAARLVVAAATKRLWITNAYFTPPTLMLEQLEAKARQGVDVRVLGPGPRHDVPLVRASQRSTYERLLKAGVRIWEYQPSMLHAKTMLVDDWLCMVGSTNLDSLSLHKLSEGSLVFEDRSMARRLERCWLEDARHAKEVCLKHGGRTTVWRRLARQATQWMGRDR